MTTTTRLKLTPPLIALLLAIGLFILGGILNPGFMTPDLALNIIRVAAFLGIIAAGQTLVIISGGEGIDLSVGTVVTLSAILAARIINDQDSMILPGLAVSLIAGALVGIVNGAGITFLRLPPLVMTLGMAGVVHGTILAITQGQMEGRAASLMNQVIARPLIGPIAGVTVLWLVLGGLMWLLLNRTPYGKYLYAIGTNRVTARLSGVNVSLIVIVTYMLSGILAALGGFVLLADTNIVFLQLGNPYILPSVASVVVGGTQLAGGQGSYMGTMSGAIVLTLIDSLLRTVQLPEAARNIAQGVILLLLLAVYGRQRNLRQ
jgi:ribose transport system permease protein